MKAKTMIELLSLSTNLYLISRDKEAMESLSKWVDKGKEKWNEVMESNKDGEETDLMQRIVNKAKQAKEELDQKMEEIAVKAYAKMHIAHTNDLNFLQEKIAALENKVSVLESQVKK